jgi:hypothetical protein
MNGSRSPAVNVVTGSPGGAMRHGLDRLGRRQLAISILVERSRKRTIEKSEGNYVHDSESFANEGHPFVKRSTIEALSAKVISVSFSPIRQRSISSAAARTSCLQTQASLLSKIQAGSLCYTCSPEGVTCRGSGEASYTELLTINPLSVSGNFGSFDVRCGRRRRVLRSIFS